MHGDGYDIGNLYERLRETRLAIEAAYAEDERRRDEAETAAEAADDLREAQEMARTK
jgi:hypothetical protein